MAARHLLSAVAAAALLVCHPVSALTLGRLTVQSALGEALVADVDVTGLTPEEAATLNPGQASADAYRAAGVDMNPVLSDVRAKLMRRPDGSAFIRVSGDRAVNDPFIDLILNFTWSGGNLQRAYTLLVDPRPTNAPASTSVPVAGFSATPTPATAPAAAVNPAPASPNPPPAAAPLSPAAMPPAATSVARASTPAPRGKTPAAPVDNAAAVSEGSAPSGSSEYVVQRGDSLARIAQSRLPSGVSLDQMMVSLFRSNQDAFQGKNMNRLRSGAVLTIPDAMAATSLSASEARRIVRAQSANFASYRQNISPAVPSVGSQPERQAGGKIDAVVQDPKGTGSAAGDQLRMTPGNGRGSALETQAAKEAERKANQARLAELQRNTSELGKVTSAGTPPGLSTPPTGAKPNAGGLAVPAVPSTTVIAPKPPLPAPVVPPSAVASSPAKPASGLMVPPVASAVPLVVTPIGASAPASEASAPSAAASAASMPASVAAAASAASGPASAPRPVPKPRPPEPEEESFLDMVPEPVVPVAGGLMAVLLGLGAMRLWQRRRDANNETSFAESKLQADSFFGTSGGQRVDTRESGAPSSSSLSYSLSQLDAIGDVDPVAEADVYLAYGRDLQAEEILKEALRTDPNRLAIRTKLLEVYAKREDARAFEAQARQVQEITGGLGDEWQRVVEMGQQIDPANSMYRLAASTVDLDTSVNEDALAALANADTRPNLPTPPMMAPPPLAPEVDLDIDLGAPSQLTGLENTRPVSMLQPPELPVMALPKLDDFPEIKGVPSVQVQALPPQAAPVAPPPTDPGPPSVHSGLDFSLSDLSLDLGIGTLGQPPAPAAAPVQLTGNEVSMLNFEDVMAELAPTAAPALAPAPVPEPIPVVSAPVASDDPMFQKIELAEEFRLIGDDDGARELLQEVLAQGSPALKQRAQVMLNELS